MALPPPAGFIQPAGSQPGERISATAAVASAGESRNRASGAMSGSFITVAFLTESWVSYLP